MAITKSMFLHMRKGKMLSAFAFPSPELVGFDHVFAVATDPWPGGSTPALVQPHQRLARALQSAIQSGGGLETFWDFPICIDTMCKGCMNHV